MSLALGNPQRNVLTAKMFLNWTHLTNVAALRRIHTEKRVVDVFKFGFMSGVSEFNHHLNLRRISQLQNRNVFCWMFQTKEISEIISNVKVKQ